ncbi:nuclear transport factor 2 family protein [Ralstonia insidiosa]|uniref:nuclear transport factor 2 family protein n=1 Tax=Ralstonia TaxID=48736 RepID=UPI00066EB642|nr:MULTISPECIES: nuclear transport factor 2 family protein [Ralstonia]MBY4708086.1 nuclear transport factor 2 family protein [Ralstonia insidiosa]
MEKLTMSLEEKMQRLIDIEDIRTLMSKYCHGIDKKDEATFMSIWADDGVYELPRGQMSGTEGIRQLVHKVWREVPKCHHHITNPLIDVDGDEASAKTDVIYYRQTDDGVLQLLSGTYTFEYVKRSGEWKTKRLKFTSFETVSPVFKDNIQG